jgi:hypothetical protein
VTHAALLTLSACLAQERFSEARQRWGAVDGDDNLEFFAFEVVEYFGCAEPTVLPQ